MKQFFLCSAAVAVLAVASHAQAAGFMVRENSAAGLGMSFAGNGSRADDASTVFNNPAGMTRIDGTEAATGTAAVFPAINFDGSSSVLGSPVPGNNGGQAGATTGIPHLYGTFDLAPGFKGGLAITVPFGNTTNYDNAGYGRYVGLKTSALSFDINPNVAYRVNEYLSVAAGVSAQYFRLDVSQAIPQFLIFGAGTPDAITNFKADGWSWGWNIGALLEVDARTRVGATYRSQVDHEIEGALDYANANPLLGLTSGPASSDVSLPASATVSLTHEVMGVLTAFVDAQWTGWSSFDAVVIENIGAPVTNVQNYEDSWMISAGLAYHLNPNLTLRGGVGWDQTPVSDQFRTVGVPDQDRIMVGIGFGYQLSNALALDAAYSHYFATEKATMNQSANRLDPIAGVIALQGDYDLGLDYVALTLRYRR